jgi:hypothetical protein
VARFRPRAGCTGRARFLANCCMPVRLHVADHVFIDSLGRLARQRRSAADFLCRQAPGFGGGRGASTVLSRSTGARLRLEPLGPHALIPPWINPL